MLHVIDLLLTSLLRLFYSRRTLLLENLALRQQLVVLKRRHSRPQFTRIDKVFWVLAKRFWSHWEQALIAASPETVVRWHHAGFRLYWTWLSRHQICFGRKRISKELRELIFKMVTENPTWGGASHSRRITNVWLRCFGADGFPLGSAGSEES